MPLHLPCDNRRERKSSGGGCTHAAKDSAVKKGVDSQSNKDMEV